MARHTPETLLLSGMVNQQDATAHVKFGVTSAAMYGYRAEFDWIVSFNDGFGRCPTRDEFKSQFPEFPFSEDQDEVRWPATEVVREYASRKLSRALIKASGELKSGNVEAAYDELKHLELHQVVSDPGNLIVDPAFLDDYDQVPDRLAMPWPTLQRLTDGIGRGELWYFAARPGQGKSQFMLEIAADAAMRGQHTIVYALEMSKRQMQVRLHAILARKLGIKISHHELKSRQYDRLAYKRLLERLEAEVAGVIHIHSPRDGATTPAVVAARAGDYDLTVVDYIGLMRSNSGASAVSDWRVAAEISNDLKSVALAKDARIISASQINRDGDSSNGRPPKLKNLTGSDALGQDGDAVVTMARYGKGVSMLSLEKNRDGESQVYFWTRFDADRGDFTEITRDQADDLRDNEED